MNNHYRKETYINICSCPKGYNSCLQGLNGLDKSHPGTSTVAMFQTLINRICQIRLVKNRALVNAFNMSGLHVPPIARFVSLCHWVTLPHFARRRLLCLSSRKNTSNSEDGMTKLSQSDAKIGIISENDIIGEGNATIFVLLGKSCVKPLLLYFKSKLCFCPPWQYFFLGSSHFFLGSSHLPPVGR